MVYLAGKQISVSDQSFIDSLKKGGSGLHVLVEAKGLEE